MLWVLKLSRKARYEWQSFGHLEEEKNLLKSYPLWQLIMNKGEAESSFLLWTYSGYQRGFDFPIKGKLAGLWFLTCLFKWCLIFLYLKIHFWLIKWPKDNRKTQVTENFSSELFVDHLSLCAQSTLFEPGKPLFKCDCSLLDMVSFYMLLTNNYWVILRWRLWMYVQAFLDSVANKQINLLFIIKYLNLTEPSNSYPKQCLC